MKIIKMTFALILFSHILHMGVYCQSTIMVKGIVTLDKNNTPMHNVSITLVQLRWTTETNEKGEYQFEQVPPGKYTILVHMEGFPDVARTIVS
jgi:iron complex outermembrane recepter protein